MDENALGTQVIGAAIEVHRYFGPGLLESVYEEALTHELQEMGLNFQRQIEIPIVYKQITLDKGFRADLIIENKILLELKSVVSIEAVHKKQLQTYLRLTKLRLGYLINFNVELLKQGITRSVNQLPEP